VKACTSIARVLLFLAFACLIVARVSGTHLHLCFDGSEPRASIHLGEDGEADLHFGAQSPHDDLDVSLVANVVVKLAAAGVDLLPAIIAAIVLFGLLQTAVIRAPVARSAGPALTPTFELRPPPRGPPA
jgi:hypothetical protein